MFVAFFVFVVRSLIFCLFFTSLTLAESIPGLFSSSFVDVRHFASVRSCVFTF